MLTILSNSLQYLEDTLTWLIKWENEINSKINEVKEKKKAENELEFQNLKHTCLKEELKEKKKSIEKNINDKYKPKIDYWKNNFLSQKTAEGLRVTLRSVIDLSKYLLKSCDCEYVLTAKLNQDALEVIIYTIILYIYI